MSTPHIETPAKAPSKAPSNGPTIGNRKQLSALLVVVLIALLLGLGWFVWWWKVASLREVTDNAYVGGRQVLVSARVAGQVSEVYADETQAVRVDQLLVTLDAADATVALERAKAELGRAVLQTRQLIDTAAQQEAVVAGRKGELALAESDLRRREPLLVTRAIAPEQVAHAQSQVAVARAALAGAERQLAAARAVTGGSQPASNPSVLAARAAFLDAWLRLDRERVLSPVTGDVAERTVQPGQNVAAGATLMRVIPREGLWVEANFKEGELANLRVGQPASVSVDVYGGGVIFHGHVAGFSAGTGQAFALLPPQNAVGNWVKVVQRLPVRIALDPKELVDHPLRIGLSATVKIDTVDRSGPLLAPASETAPSGEPTPSDPALVTAEAEADQIIAHYAAPARRP